MEALIFGGVLLLSLFLIPLGLPGTWIMVPMLTTGLDGATSTASAVSSASRTAGSTAASSAPTEANRCAAGLAWWRTHHSWKCTATCGGASSDAAASRAASGGSTPR